ncbi:serine/threonine-protein phosphatase 7 long form-like protein, partial [Trifolium medium]|nr:serine/threonine-protein phosphatase 7 long form-like protein [Trifolium medium]
EPEADIDPEPLEVEPLQVEMPDEEDNGEEMQQEVHEVEDMIEAQSEPNEENRGLIKIVSNGKKLAKLNFIPTNEEWWDNVIKATEKWSLVNTSYSFLDRALLATFVDRWHGDTNNFHIPDGEITITLDDVHYLLHLPIEG